MAGCGEQPPGGRKPNVDKESDHQRPESSDDRSAAPPKENPKHPMKKTILTGVQLNTLEGLFKKQQYVSYTEREQLAKQLSLPQRNIQIWFQNRRAKLRNQALNSQPDPVWGWSLDSKTLTQDQRDFLHINWVQAQKRSYLDMFPPPRPMDSYALTRGQHLSGMIYCQNVGGPPYCYCGTDVYKMLPGTCHKPPNTFLLNQCLPNRTVKPGTSIWNPVSSITTDLRSSAPSTPQMPIAPDNADAADSD